MNRYLSSKSSSFVESVLGEMTDGGQRALVGFIFMAVTWQSEDTVLKVLSFESFQVIVSSLPRSIIIFLQSPLSLLIINGDEDVVLGCCASLVEFVIVDSINLNFSLIISIFHPVGSQNSTPPLSSAAHAALLSVWEDLESFIVDCHGDAGGVNVWQN